MNKELITKMTYPFYDQLATLGELFDEDSIDYAFLKATRQFFAQQYFFELKLIFKADKRAIRREFKAASDEERRVIRNTKKELKAAKQAVELLKRKKKPLLASESVPPPPVENSQALTQNTSLEKTEETTSQTQNPAIDKNVHKKL